MVPAGEPAALNELVAHMANVLEARGFRLDRSKLRTRIVDNIGVPGAAAVVDPDGIRIGGRNVQPMMVLADRLQRGQRGQLNANQQGALRLLTHEILHTASPSANDASYYNNPHNVQQEEGVVDSLTGYNTPAVAKRLFGSKTNPVSARSTFSYPTRARNIRGFFGSKFGPVHSRETRNRQAEFLMSDSSQRGEIERRMVSMPQFGKQAFAGRAEGRRQKDKPAHARMRR